MVTYEPRSAWRARAARGSTGLVASQVEGEALHWPGMAKPINAAGDAGKARVASALRGWQTYHMDSKGWSDIAYQIAIDQVGRAWTLRGLNIRSGANGDADVNRRFGAFLLILAPGEQPSAAMKATVKGVISDFRRRFPHASATPKGHKDVRAAGTDCPGPLAYAAIKRGEFTPTGGIPQPPTPTPPKDGIMSTAETEAAAASRYSDLKDTMVKWAEEHDAARQAALITHLDALAEQLTTLLGKVNALGSAVALIKEKTDALPKAP